MQPSHVSWSSNKVIVSTIKKKNDKSYIQQEVFFQTKFHPGMKFYMLHHGMKFTYKQNFVLLRINKILLISQENACVGVSF